MNRNNKRMTQREAEYIANLIWKILGIIIKISFAFACTFAFCCMNKVVSGETSTAVTVWFYISIVWALLVTWVAHKIEGD